METIFRITICKLEVPGRQAEPDARPPGAASPSGKLIEVIEIPLAAGE